MKRCYDGGTCTNEVLIEELESRLAAADALATEVSPAIEIINAGRLYIEIIGTGGERDKRVLKVLQTISDGLTVALRKYREANDG